MRTKLTKIGIYLGFLLVFLFVSSCDSKPKQALVVGKLQSMTKLATTEIVVSKLIIGRKDLNILFFRELNSATFVVDTEATIKLGIDFSKIEKGDVEIEGRSISIRVPQVEVINFSYPADKFSLNAEWTNDSKFLNKIRPEDQEVIYRNAELSIRENLTHLGAIKTCQKMTTVMLRKMLEELGFDEIYISHKPTFQLFPEFNFSKKDAEVD